MHVQSFTPHHNTLHNRILAVIMHHFVSPSLLLSGVNPPRSTPPVYIAGLVVAFLVLLFLLLLLIVLFLVVCLRRRCCGNRKHHDSLEHTYEALGIVPVVSKSEGITVVPNEAYGVAEAQPESLSYGSIRMSIKEPYNNLTITLNHQ